MRLHEAIDDADIGLMDIVGGRVETVLGWWVWVWGMGYGYWVWVGMTEE